jgi:hypothetical protein
MIENRRSRRKRADGIEVANALTGEAIGQLGNLSIDGMLLIANRNITGDALFQFKFELPGPGGTAHPVEIGVHEQWSEPARTPGQFWVGFRIIDIAPDERAIVSAWIDRHDEEPKAE